MARNDGIDRTFARNRHLKKADVVNVQKHNERMNDIYVNPDIVLDRSQFNVHFKTPSRSYEEMFDQLKGDGVISTRGLKDDAVHYGELLFDVNSAYFHNHGGYEFAKKFYEDAYQAAIDIIGGEQYILSAVMHADERNRAMSEALGKDVYHYHLHVVYVPVVEKQILWSKRCKDKSLIGTVKETIMQVSSSKKWASKQVVDEQGNIMFTSTGKKVLKKSYSVLQDDFFNAMRKKGYDDVERGERGSTEEHLSVTQFKLEQDKERLEVLNTYIEKKEQKLKKIEQRTKVQNEIAKVFDDIDKMGQTTITGKVQLTQEEAANLKKLAKAGVSAKAEILDLKHALTKAKKDIAIWKDRYEKLKEQTKDFMKALKRAPELVNAFVKQVLLVEVDKHKVKDKKIDKSVQR